MLRELDGEHRMIVEVGGTLVRIVCKVDGKPTMVAELNLLGAIGLANSLLEAIHQIVEESFSSSEVQ